MTHGLGSKQHSRPEPAGRARAAFSPLTWRMIMLKKLVSGIGQFVNMQAGKGLVARRQHQLRKCEQEAILAVTAAYRSRYPREHLYAPIATVIEAVHDYAERHLGEWRSLPMRQAADGRSAQLQYTLDFRDVFEQGGHGSPLEPLTMAASTADGILAHRGQSNKITVPYHLRLDLRLEAITDTCLCASCVATEEIDPKNECGPIRSGNYRAPSRMASRCNGDPGERLLVYLAAAVPQERPTVDEWIKLDEAKRDPAVVAQREKIAAAERALEEAEAALAQQRGAA